MAPVSGRTPRAGGSGGHTLSGQTTRGAILGALVTAALLFPLRHSAPCTADAARPADDGVADATRARVVQLEAELDAARRSRGDLDGDAGEIARLRQENARLMAQASAARTGASAPSASAAAEPRSAADGGDEEDEDASDGAAGGKEGGCVTQAEMKAFIASKGDLSGKAGKLVECEMKVKMLRSDVRQYKEGGIAVCGRELTKIQEKAAQIKSVKLEVDRGRCGAAVMYERDFWREHLLNVMTVAMSAETKLWKVEGGTDASGAGRSLLELQGSVETASNLPAGAIVAPEVTLVSGVLETGAKLGVSDGVTMRVAEALGARKLLNAAHMGVRHSKEETHTLVEDAEKQWLDSLREAGPTLTNGLKTAATGEDRAKYVSRTKDAEKAMPHIFEGMEREGEKWEDQWEKRKAKRMGKMQQYSKNQKSASAKGATAQSQFEGDPPPEYRSCALVGNSNRMLLHELGDEINKHDTVMRLNNAPTLGYERHVGNRTTHRLINNQWTTNYGAPPSRLQRLPLEWNATLIVSRMAHAEYYAVVEQVKLRRSDVKLVRMTHNAVVDSGEFLSTLKDRIEESRGFKYAGRGSPSSGLFGTWILLQLCDSVTVYGMGLSTCFGVQTENNNCLGGPAWHYWQEDTFFDSREFMDDPHHSFQLEHDVLRVLDGAGVIKFVAPTPAVSRVEMDNTLKTKTSEAVEVASERQVYEKAVADFQCARATGMVCGCPKPCVLNDKWHESLYRTHVKSAMAVLGQNGAAAGAQR